MNLREGEGGGVFRAGVGMEGSGRETSEHVCIVCYSTYMLEEETWVCRDEICSGSRYGESHNFSKRNIIN